jgi:hypothetical protein
MAAASHPMGLIAIAVLMVSCLVASHTRGERLIAAIAPSAWIALGAGIELMRWELYA